MLDLSSILPNFRITDAVDIVLVAALLYLLLLALRQTRTSFVVVGAGLLAGLYVTAIAFDLRLSRYLIQLVVAVAFLALIVMFHEELRAAAERLLSLRFRRRGVARAGVDPGTVETLVSTMADLAHERIGALVVLPGLDDPSRFMRGGNKLDGVLSEALLKSVFDSHSMGHDGAVLLSGDRVARFACHLPLSSDSSKIGKRGTRHAAALGLSERTDSLCLVVSEERGTISVARHGVLEQLDDLGRLNDLLRDFEREVAPEQPRRKWSAGLLRNMELKAAALVGALLLWFLVVHEGSTEYHSFVVQPTPVGQGDRVVSDVDPPRVQVVVSGPRRLFYWTDASDVHVNLPLVDRGPGQHDLFLTATSVELPEGIVFVNLVPRNVRVTITE